MKEYKVTRYSFNELSEEARERAIVREQELTHEFLPTEVVGEVLAEEVSLALSGDREALIGSLKSKAWDLSYSQGSHVGIDGEIEVSKAPLINWPAGAHSVKFNHHHYYGQRVTLFNSEGDELDDSGELRDELRKVERSIMSAGYKFIDGMTSREVAIESLNELEEPIFLESGERDYPRGISA